jgi:hypothetical protein
MSRARHRLKDAAVLSAFLVIAAVVASSLRQSEARTMSHPLDYDRAIDLDAEDLAEAGIGEAYERLRPEFQKHVREPARVEESIDDETPRYSVKCGTKEFTIYGPEVEGDTWGRATFVFFTLVNEQLADSEYRFYAINGGNDLLGIFLTPAQAQAAQRALPNKRDWPYLPDDRPPWFGQHH